MIDAQIPKMVFQTSLDDYEVRQEQIDKVKDKRLDSMYKQSFGMSLSKFILACREEGLSSHQTKAKILQEEGIRIYMYENPEKVQDLYRKININVSARFSEEDERGR